jgi:hypothetical protein
MWYNTFDGAFWITMAGICIGFFGLVLRLCYKSKCKQIECGCIKIIRDTENEEKLDELNTKSDSKDNNI